MGRVIFRSGVLEAEVPCKEYWRGAATFVPERLIAQHRPLGSLTFPSASSRTSRGRYCIGVRPKRQRVSTTAQRQPTP
jgi:hypothetical protein